MWYYTYRIIVTAQRSFFVGATDRSSTRPRPAHEITSPSFSSKLVLVAARQFTRTSPALMRSAILLRESLKPADASASSLRDASKLLTCGQVLHWRPQWHYCNK